MKYDKENQKRPETEEHKLTEPSKNTSAENEKSEEVLPTGIKPDGTDSPRDYEGNIPTELEKINLNEKNRNEEKKNPGKEFNDSKDK